MIELKNTFEIQKQKIYFSAKPQDCLYSQYIRLCFVSNGFQEPIHKTDALPLLCSNRSPILFSLDMIKEGQREKGLWKFKSSLLSNKRFVRNLKKYKATTTVFVNE